MTPDARREAITRVWFLVAERWRVRFIPADQPCWKGEVQVGRLVLGWQRGPDTP